MFPISYFPAAHFAPRYFPRGGVLAFTLRNVDTTHKLARGVQIECVLARNIEERFRFAANINTEHTLAMNVEDEFILPRNVE